MAKKEALCLANQVSVISRRQSQEKGRVLGPVLQRFFILPAIIWFPKNYFFTKGKILFQADSYRVLESVTVCLMLLRHRHL